MILSRARVGCLSCVMALSLTCLAIHISDSTRYEKLDAELNSCDHVALRSAGRYMIDHMEDYRTSRYYDSAMSSENEVFLMHGEFGKTEGRRPPWGNEVPEVVGNLNPHWIRIHKKDVEFMKPASTIFGRGARSGIVVFVDGDGALDPNQSGDSYERCSFRRYADGVYRID